MTKDEAIYYLKAIIEDGFFGDICNEKEEAVNMAIEALKAQPCEDVIVFDDFKEGFIPCEDAVSREAALIALTDLSDSYADKGKEYHPHIDFVIDTIKSLPSVQPERARGEWINERWIGTNLVGVTCSNCMVIDSRFSDFCPNCGAKMEGESE